MKNMNWIALGLLLILSTGVVYWLMSKSCNKVNVGRDKLPGIYTMIYSSVIDTLIIEEDGTFYHSFKEGSTNSSYIRNGTWKETVDGYYELLNYSSASIVNSWDMQPFMCGRTGKIYIPSCADGECRYKKLEP